MTSTARRRLAVAGLLVAGLLAGGAVAAGAATPGPSPSAERSGPAADEERTAERDAAKAARRAAKADRRAAKAERKAERKAGRTTPTGPAFVCDPTLNHGQNVSAYARSLPKGPGRGRLVSQAARSDCGKAPGTDDD